jgi:peptide methionine sulfoxide reductase MsrA
VIHDPQQADGQGHDIGSQYLSAVFYCSEEQRAQAEKKIGELKGEGLKIATKLLPLTNFYPAENYHQNYWNLRGRQNPYCNIIPGKIAKMRKYFKE